MKDKIKFYCVFLDTMPLFKEIIDMANKNKMQRFIQVGGCFTATSLTEMFTGKMPSDFLEKGIGHRSFDKYRNKKTKKIDLPWSSEFITNILSKNNWKIHIHDCPSNSIFKGDFYTDSYKGGYMKRYNKILKNKDKSYSGKMMDKILLGKEGKDEGWQKRELEFIRELQNKKHNFNIFYLIEYEHFHSLSSYKKKVSKSICMKRAKRRTLELLSEWDFDEPNAIFWFFSDHGFPEEIGKIPNAKNYLSWVIFKDNTVNNVIKSKSKIISIRDFIPTIMNKLNYKYKNIKENYDINKEIDKNRIYFIEDGRGKINKKESTSAVSCKIVKWKNNNPINILQVGYFKNNKKFYYHLNFLDKSGFFKKYIKIKGNDKKYLVDILYLKKELIKRFKWVK